MLFPIMNVGSMHLTMSPKKQNYPVIIIRQEGTKLPIYIINT